MKLRTERPGQSATVGTGLTPPLSAADAGLLLLRLTVGLTMAGHGAQKLFGLFGGQGLEATGKWFAHLGYEPGVFFAGLTGTSELLGGLGLALGLFTPLAAAAVFGIMINAMAVDVGKGLWSTSGGIEYPMTVAAVALAVAAVGPGRLSLDGRFPWRDGGWLPAAFVLCFGGLAAALVLVF
ncbi:DoxX family membrane protein [Streptomyces sannanensis]|uniref:DoxX family membrane protein n=1 Tax=Streptomyces sannanensis TaxID=285536 RepID=A0ABP6SCZ7_9ACTN